MGRLLLESGWFLFREPSSYDGGKVVGKNAKIMPRLLNRGSAVYLSDEYRKGPKNEGEEPRMDGRGD